MDEQRRIGESEAITRLAPKGGLQPVIRVGIAAGAFEAIKATPLEHAPTMIQRGPV